MIRLIKNKKIEIILWVFIIAYALYFSYFTILRYKTLYASYYDLGIMHQTVYNSYQAIKTGDWGRFLELTNPTGVEQIKRMAIHSDILLGLISPFYFIHAGPETLLVIQSIVSALGALAIFKIAVFVFQKINSRYFIALIFSLCYLLYVPFERANIYDFHAVTLSTTLLLFMFYFWLVKKYKLSFLFFLLSIISKEQVALTTMMFGLYSILIFIRHSGKRIDSGQARMTKAEKIFSLSMISFSIFWFVASVFYIIPLFRGGQHFAVQRYSDFGDSPIRIIIGTITNPYSISKYILRVDTLGYLVTLLGPVGFLSLLSPTQLIIASPEFAINLLSKNPNMRNIIYQYTAVITPFVFISAIYGAKRVIGYLLLVIRKKSIKNVEKKIIILLSSYLFIFTLVWAYQKGPLLFSREADIHPLKYPQKEIKDVAFWARTLQDEQLKISTTGQLSPFFTSRRYFYTFSARYRMADYVIVRLNEIYSYPEKWELIPVYEKLKEDYNYNLIYKRENFEVYKKVKS